MAERKGFEPLKALTPWRFSRPLVSTSSRIFPLAGVVGVDPTFLGLEPSTQAVVLHPSNIGGSYPIRTDGPYADHQFSRLAE